MDFEDLACAAHAPVAHGGVERSERVNVDDAVRHEWRGIVVVLDDRPLIEFEQQVAAVVVFDHHVVRVIVRGIHVRQGGLGEGRELLVAGEPVSPSADHLGEIRVIPHLDVDAESFEDLRAEGIQLTFRIVMETERALLFVVDAEEPFGLGLGRAVMLCDDDQQAIVPEHTEAHEVAGTGHADWLAVLVVETPFGAAVRFVAPRVVPCGFKVGDRRCVIVAQVHERGGYAVPLGCSTILAGAEQSSERVVAAELVLVAAVGVDIDGRQFLGRDRADVVADSSVIAHNP